MKSQNKPQANYKKKKKKDTDQKAKANNIELLIPGDQKETKGQEVYKSNPQTVPQENGP